MFENLPIFTLMDGYDVGLRRLIASLPESVKQNALRSAAQAEAAPKSRGYVFISYAEEDSDFVDTLRDFLGVKGYGYWDYQASDRNFHTQLFLELEEVIKNAAATLSVLSPDWKKSTWTAKEYIFSEEVGTPVFLLMSREMGPTLVTAGVPYIDFTRDELVGFERLDRELRRKGLI
ncbi:MAG: toll/interleukin-1 receptor domain-containing protein [Chloroflexi bacterium]|nr:toll/interleukin-1 receptor domain-containing protein [Chloroflexota bacterium]